MLSNRIRSVLHELIASNQYVFIKGRYILDGLLIANECVEDYSRRKKKRVVVKLDLEKAYDKTDWDSLDYVMARKAFGTLWGQWVFGCLSSTHFSIIINGFPKGFFPASRVLDKETLFPIPFYLGS